MFLQLYLKKEDDAALLFGAEPKSTDFGYLSETGSVKKIFNDDICECCSMIKDTCDMHCEKHCVRLILAPLNFS